MRFITENAIWIGLALGSGFMLLWPLLQGRGASTSISPSDAVLLINRSNAVVLDVRNDAEFAAGHVADARHIPLAQLESRLGELRKLQHKPIIVHCQTGPRAAKACDLLRKHGFEKVYSLQGGLNAWGQSRLPLVQG